MRREISLARDRVAAVKEEHKRNLVELDRERRRLKVACEETEAVRDELARATDSNELLKRRLARARGEIAKKSAEAAARADAADAAFAANARNAAIAAREALRHDDDDDVRLLGDGGVEKKKENLLTGTTSDEAGGALSSPSKFGDGISRDVFSARDLERHGSRADWARAYGRVVAELDAARARAAKAESALAAATAAGQKRATDAETSETTDGLTNETDASRRVLVASLVTRSEAAEARSLRLARLNAGLLDRLGEAVGAAPRHGEDIQRVSFFSNSADEEENAVQEVGRDVFVATTKRKSALAEKPGREANVLQDSEVKGEQTHDAHEVSDEAFFEGASSVTRKRDVLRALESEVKLLDAEYRETIEAIKRVHDGIAGGDFDRRRSRSIEVDALAARANSLEDAIVRKVEEVQRLRDDVFGVSRKIEL